MADPNKPVVTLREVDDEMERFEPRVPQAAFPASTRVLPARYRRCAPEPALSRQRAGRQSRTFHTRRALAPGRRIPVIALRAIPGIPGRVGTGASARTRLRALDRLQALWRLQAQGRIAPRLVRPERDSPIRETTRLARFSPPPFRPFRWPGEPHACCCDASERASGMPLPACRPGSRRARFPGRAWRKAARGLDS
jgi:hypothetical protein